MYLTGNAYNLEERLHQLPTGVSDLNRFRLEALSYKVNYTTGVFTDINNEFHRKYFILSGARAFYTTGNYWN